MDSVTEPFNTFLKQDIKTVSVFLGVKNILTAVAAKDYMINCAKIMNAWFTNHASCLTHEYQNVKPDPFSTPFSATPFSDPFF